MTDTAEIDALIERLERASDTLAGLAQRPTVTRFERDRLTAKAEGVRLALSYAREHAIPPGEQSWRERVCGDYPAPCNHDPAHVTPPE